MYNVRNDECPHYDYVDYVSWGDTPRMELVQGVIYMMSPSPAGPHQDAVGEIYAQIKYYLRGKQCRVYHAPFDVVFSDTTIMQPDVLVVCDIAKVGKRRVHGAPDMVAEVLSPSTSGYDKSKKKDFYEKFGVREYWIVDPDSKTVKVYLLENNAYALSGVYSANDKLAVGVLDGCSIDLKEVFSTQYDDE